MTNNIVLIGFMGSGKTAVGNLIAKKLDRRFIDSDEYITKSSGMAISDLFKEHGEAYFRELEKEAFIGISQLTCCVIATGGGAVKNPENVTVLKRNGIFVFLNSPAQKLYENIKDDFSRPLLNTPNRLETIERLLSERLPLYMAYADIVVDITNETVCSAADKIIAVYSKMKK